MAEQEYRASSMLRIVLTQFLEHRFAVIALGIIVLLMLLAIFAPVIGNWLGVNPEDQSIFNRYKPVMTTIDKSLGQREEDVEQFISEDEQRANDIIQTLRDAGMIDKSVSDEDALFEVMEDAKDDETVISQLQSLHNSEVNDFARLLNNFKSVHYLGTDELGRDVLMRLIYGARVSISIGLLVAFISAVIGLIIGSLAGYYGGILDATLMRVTDSLLSLPLIPVLILFAAANIKQIPLIGWFIRGGNESIAKMVVVLCIFSWMTAARLVRASILSIKEKEFVFAAKILGASDLRIIAMHITPNILAPLLVAVSLRVGSSIIFEAALSFLGLGVQPPTPTWGNMLYNAQEMIYEAPLLAIFPGIMIFITVICFNFVGDGLQDAIDPKSIRR